MLLIAPAFAGDAENGSRAFKIEQALRETDLSLTLKQYERVKMEAFEVHLKLLCLGTEEEMTDAAREKRSKLLRQRLEILETRAAELRDAVRKLGEAMTPAKAR